MVEDGIEGGDRGVGELMGVGGGGVGGVEGEGVGCPEGLVGGVEGVVGEVEVGEG